MCSTCGCNKAPLAPARSSRPGRIVRVEQDVLAENARGAAANRARFAQRGILALNLLSSPGSGKTTLLVETIERLRTEMPITVIEGDQQTSLDAERIRATGAPTYQINTGKGCHLDAAGVAGACEHLPSEQGGVLFIENVGNLVCPAEFDLGEAAKVVVLSVTEGEEKPLKYPTMFQAADLLLLNKVDLLPYVRFDVNRCIRHAHEVKPGTPVLQLSAITGQGFDGWLEWIRQARARVLAPQS